MADETATQTLADRLLEAEAAEAPLAVHANALKAERDTALERHDYARVVELEAEVDAACEAHRLAAAHTDGLRKHTAELEQERQAFRLVVLDQQRTDAARAALVPAQQAEADLLSELEKAVASVRVGLLAVRQNIQRGLALEEDAHGARTTVYSALVTLGDRPSGQRVQKPNRMSALLESDPVIRAVNNAWPPC